MNALFELFGKKVKCPDNIYWTPTERKDGKARRFRRPSVEVKKLLEEYRDQLQEKHPNWMLYIPNSRKILFIDRELIEQEIDEKIRWAEISRSDDTDILKTSAYLRPDRTSEDIWKFINDLFAIEYYDGFGCQELFGNVVFKDGSWLERWEYDGSEGWAHKSCPDEPNWDEIEKEASDTELSEDLGEYDPYREYDDYSV